MTGNPLVFRQDDLPIEELIEQMIKNQPHLDVRDVDVVEAARAAEGEVWSPQLPAYESWGARDAADDDAAQGADGDLLVVGALGMGISDEEREALLYAARAESGMESAAQAGAAQAELAGTHDASDSRMRARMGQDVHGAVRVRQDADGYALVDFDLHRFAAALGDSENLAVALPACVDGVPVVRVTAEALSRRLVQGVGVRVLVVPDTVRTVAAGAFSALSAHTIHLGRNVEALGDQPCDVAGVSPHLTRRAYAVDQRNPRFAAREGSLFSTDGTRLEFLASPYGAQVRIPEGVQEIGPAAFAVGCEAPREVVSSSGLERVDARTWDDAVWRCPDGAPVRRALERRGVRLAGPRAVEYERCWYDFDKEGAVLVAGPPAPTSVSKHFAVAAAVRAAAERGQSEQPDAPSPGAVAKAAAHTPGANDLLAPPRMVQGAPLVRVGVRALPHAPATLIMPDTVRVVERDNACRGTVRLVLPARLERIGAHCFCSRTLEGPVGVPASVRSIGEGSFEYAVCRLAHTGSIIHVSADQLLTCFLERPDDGIPFDFERYDDLLRSAKNLPDRLGALLHRVADPHRPPRAVREALVAQLRERERDAQQRVAREGDRAMVEALVEAGFIDECTFERQIELLRVCNRTDCVAYLMEWHREQGGPVKALPARERFAL